MFWCLCHRAGSGAAIGWPAVVAADSGVRRNSCRAEFLSAAAGSGSGRGNGGGACGGCAAGKPGKHCRGQSGRHPCCRLWSWEWRCGAALHLRSNSDSDADDHAATSSGAIADATGTAPGNSLKTAPGTALAKLPWANGAAAIVAGVLVVAIGSALLGYVALGSFLVKQLAWSATVLATVYLVNALLDDFFSAWLGTAPVPPTDDEAPAHGPRIRAQAGVLLSALSRLAVLLFAAVLVMAPFGQGPGELFDRAGQLRDGVAIGAVRLHPATVMQGLLVFALAAITVRLLQRWLRERYLPTTRLDAAMRDSATSLLGFVGIFAAFALALSAVGLGLERIAWVASALSVGIGFGLQAVVSNFVSGLILLAERPVKVGDWVSLSRRGRRHSTHQRSRDRNSDGRPLGPSSCPTPNSSPRSCAM